jgi:hypothetical protein
MKIDLNIAYSDAPSYQLQNFFNETISLTKGDSLKRISRVINNEHEDKFYKLAFKDLELNNYLILVKDNVDKKSGLREKVMPQDNTVYCPFCLEKINTEYFAQIEKSKSSNNLVSCRGKTSKATIYENDKLVSELPPNLCGGTVGLVIKSAVDDNDKFFTVFVDIACSAAEGILTMNFKNPKPIEKLGNGFTVVGIIDSSINSINSINNY